MSNLSQTGLSASTVATIQAILAQVPAVEHAVLYGSRAKGTHKPGSDIDLTLFGKNITADTILRLAGAFDESSLPYTFDLSHFDSLKNTDLRDHIQRVGLELYRRESPTIR